MVCSTWTPNLAEEELVEAVVVCPPTIAVLPHQPWQQHLPSAVEQDPLHSLPPVTGTVDPTAAIRHQRVEASLVVWLEGEGVVDRQPRVVVPLVGYLPGWTYRHHPAHPLVDHGLGVIAGRASSGRLCT